MKAYFVFLIAFLTSCGGVKKYDALVEANAVCDQKWADIETELQRRYDLIPNLVATVKASAAHEEKVLEEVTTARASASQVKLSADDLSDPAKMAAFTQAQSALTGALGRLLVTQEAYPDLKANAQFHDLTVELEGTENRIARSRQEYNDAVKAYNAELAKVGGQVVNKVTGHPFKPRVYWSASVAAHEAPKVSF
ncbi:MAG TPA: LemA family protein [Kofleriaceae bacterium]|jgi:LemA protein